MAVNVEQLIEDAYELVRLRVPWVHNQRSLRGMDCLNFFIYLLEKQGYIKRITIEPYSMTPNGRHMYQTFQKLADEVSIEEARPGDVYQIRVKKNPQHLALKVSDSIPPLIIHAERGAFNCVVESVLDEETAKRVYAVFRFRDEIPDEVCV